MKSIEMSALFKTYEDEYLETNRVLAADMRAVEDLQGHARTAKLNLVQDGIDKLKELVSNMEMESNDVVESQRSQAKTRVANYKKDNYNQEREMRRLKNASKHGDRDELLRSSDGGETNAHKAAMKGNTAKLASQNEILQKSMKLVHESNEMGDQALGELSKQRDQIQRTINTARETNEEVSQSRRLLTGMQKVMVQNKAIMVLIIVILFSTICFIVYFKWVRSSSSVSPTTPGAVPPSPGGWGGGGDYVEPTIKPDLTPPPDVGRR